VSLLGLGRLGAKGLLALPRLEASGMSPKLLSLLLHLLVSQKDKASRAKLNLRSHLRLLPVQGVLFSRLSLKVKRLRYPLGFKQLRVSKARRPRLETLLPHLVQNMRASRAKLKWNKMLLVLLAVLGVRPSRTKGKADRPQVRLSALQRVRANRLELKLGSLLAVPWLKLKGVQPIQNLPLKLQRLKPENLLALHRLKVSERKIKPESLNSL
jgi:hypothetical protein